MRSFKGANEVIGVFLIGERQGSVQYLEAVLAILSISITMEFIAR